MKRLWFSCVAVLAVSLTATAQDYIHDFSDLTNYTQSRGTWTINAMGQVHGTATATFQELTYDNITNAYNGAVEALCLYDSTRPGLQYMAPITRYSATSTLFTYFMCKVQDNGAGNGFDRCWCYYYDGTRYASTGISALQITPASRAVRVRLQVCDQPAPSTSVDLHVYLDTDNDGVWDITQSAMTTLGYGTAGQIGLNGYRSSLADDLQYYGGTLKADGPARIGNAVNYDGCGASNTFYAGVCSLGNRGFPIGANRAIPVNADGMFFLTAQNFAPAIFSNFQGLTNADGTFRLTINIPNTSAIVGVRYWTSAVNGPASIIFPEEENTITT